MKRFGMWQRGYEVVGTQAEKLRREQKQSAKEQWIQAGHTHFLAGHSEDALLAYEQALRLDPNDGSTHRHIGNVLFALKRYQEALVSYERAIHLDPDDIGAHFGRTQILEQLGRLDEFGPHELETLDTIARVLNSTLEFDEVVRLVMDRMIEFVNAEHHRL